jgi:hypothetical protein
MRKIILKFRKLFSYLIPYKCCNLCVPISLENLQKILLDLSMTGIIDKRSNLFNSSESRYFVQLINNSYFLIDGPHGYKRFCLVTQGRINSTGNTNDAVIVELKMQLAKREILTMVGLWLLGLFFLIIFYKSSVIILILFLHFTFIPTLWYTGTVINFQAEANCIMRLLEYQFKSQ